MKKPFFPEEIGKETMRGTKEEIGGRSPPENRGKNLLFYSPGMP
ncbi:MAG: hypothetical protein ABIK84_02265 [candidate division WOR-3 bacterium]